jgi:NADH:ubiquinone oxidoreductase subunit 2 (subunit N)
MSVLALFVLGLNYDKRRALWITSVLLGLVGIRLISLPSRLLTAFILLELQSYRLYLRSSDSRRDARF